MKLPALAHGGDSTPNTNSPSIRIAALIEAIFDAEFEICIHGPKGVPGRIKYVVAESMWDEFPLPGQAAGCVVASAFVVAESFGIATKPLTYSETPGKKNVEKKKYWKFCEVGDQVTNDSKNIWYLQIGINDNMVGDNRGEL